GELRAQIGARVQDRPSQAVRRHGEARLGARRHIRIAAPRAHRVVGAVVPLRQPAARARAEHPNLHIGVKSRRSRGKAAKRPRSDAKQSEGRSPSASELRARGPGWMEVVVVIPYLSPVVELYLQHLIPWDEYFALRKGSDVDARSERETLESILQTAA